MKIIIIRHGDPNYALDCLTEQGKKEASLLADYLKDEKIDYVYVSPLGRAQETCNYYLNKTNKSATTYEWLKEFGNGMTYEYITGMRHGWDFMPDYWTKNDIFFDKDNWMNYEDYKKSGLDLEYKRVVSEFDKLIEKHGYKRNNNLYEVTNSSHDTIAFFCHFGLESVLLSRLLNVSPFILWHQTCALSTSVTRVVTEERQKGIASFRMIEFGCQNHLRNANEDSTTSALFKECYEDIEKKYI